MKKLLFFLFTFFLSLSVFVTPVMAKQNEKNVFIGQDQVINEDYFAGGDTVTVLGTINGDAYVAGGNITFDGIVNGDIIAAGGTVTIKGTAQNVRVSGGTITIDGTIEKNLTVFGGNIILSKDTTLKGSLVAGGGSITLSGPIGKGAKIGGGNVVIDTSVNGNIYAGVGQLTLQPEARINGNLVYASDEPAQILPGAAVSGKLTHNVAQKPQREKTNQAALGLGTAALIFKLIDMVSLFILGLVLITLAPSFVKRVADGIATKPWQSLGIGLLTVLIGPIVFIALLITVVGIPLAFIFLALFVISLYLAKLFVIYLVGEKIGSSIHNKMHVVLLFLIGLIVYEILTFIPFVGWLIDCVALLFGLGSLLIQKKHLYKTLRKQKTV